MGDLSAQTRLGVVGWPVAHSRSPAIQNAALTAVGLRDWRYQLLPVPPDLFEETVTALAAAGFRGVNVTIPHKEAALRLATEPTARAKAIGAANTLVFAESTIEADNTDAPALIEALPSSPSGKTALVLGAGGSARAAVWALVDAGAEKVWVWNRTAERASALSEQLGAIPVDSSRPADFLINCTSIGLDEQDSTFKQLPLAADDLARYDCVVDLVYTSHETALVRAARERGISVVDGLDLLVRQGALSFERFTGRPAPLEVMRAAAGDGG
jgi:shikimate dehydrogenase